MNKDTAKDYLPLVQALADGKVIQILEVDGAWVDVIPETFFTMPASSYRIKPEPREIWVNEYPDGFGFHYRTKEDAEKFGVGVRQVCFREVLE